MNFVLNNPYHPVTATQVLFYQQVLDFTAPNIAHRITRSFNDCMELLVQRAYEICKELNNGK